ncbi:MAG: thaumarchaeosortase [Candidatus Nitrosothermus koennekii]|nr:MAG: thaumarchaeosortase [Candidatus Nitrosothermus koennekii]
MEKQTLKSNDIYIAIVLLASPIIYTLIIAPDTFNMSWNEGRGGFLFALAFIVAELVGLNYTLDRKRLYIAIPIIALTFAYFTVLDYGLRDYIRNSAEVYNVNLVDSWIWMWDFVILSIFMISMLFILFGKRWIRIAPASPIYLVGSAIILSLDAFFPFDTLGPLQFIVPYVLQIDAWIINTLDIGSAYANSNLLLLNGEKGSMALQVFWPSAGVHSMIIYTLVMLAFLLKMNIPPKRKAIYFVIGAVGTFVVNTIRIFSLSVFVLTVSANPVEFEEFHSVAGEIMFLPWLAVYLFLVMRRESKKAREGLSIDKTKS